MQERLQKILARVGICSRRKAEEYIRAGKVRVDGQIVTELGFRADPGTQQIEFDGTPVPAPEKKLYLLLNKPKGYVTTLDDPQGRPIVTSLLTGVQERVYPVGRLDQDTEGALILTNDGELAQRILHPSNEIGRTYLAKVHGHPQPDKLALLEHGLVIEGRKTWPAKIKIVSRQQKFTTIEIIIHEGRKRQVRKMFAAIGHKVAELKRTAYGSLKLGKLPSGAFRVLTQDDIRRVLETKKQLYI